MAKFAPKSESDSMKITKVTARLLIGILAILFVPFSADAADMTFFIETDPRERLGNKLINGGIEDVYAVGEISPGTTSRFLNFVRENDIQAAKVHFNSPGGSLFEGMRLGRALRELQFFTTVGVHSVGYDPDKNKASRCASACVYAFAGGTARFLTAYSGRLGLHQFYGENEANVTNESVQEVSGLIVAYFEEMGVDTRAFTVSTLADRNGMIWLNPEEALALRFANNGSLRPTAEIKLSGLIPYLRVEQEHSNVTTRVLFDCVHQRLRMTFGFVTDPTSSAFYAQNQKRSYLELDYTEFMVIDGDTGASSEDSAVWITRLLTASEALKVVKADDLSGWIDGFGAVRYGGNLEVPPIRAEIADFALKCFGQN